MMSTYIAMHPDKLNPRLQLPVSQSHVPQRGVLAHDLHLPDAWTWHLGQGNTGCRVRVAGAVGARSAAISVGCQRCALEKLAAMVCSRVDSDLGARRLAPLSIPAHQPWPALSVALCPPHRPQRIDSQPVEHSYARSSAARTLVSRLLVCSSFGGSPGGAGMSASGSGVSGPPPVAQQRMQHATASMPMEPTPRRPARCSRRRHWSPHLCAHRISALAPRAAQRADSCLSIPSASNVLPLQ